MAAKRPSLMAGMKAARDRTGMAPAVIPPVVPAEAPAEAGAPPVPLAGPPRRDRTLTDSSATTALHIPKDLLHLLRLVAVTRANRDGGRPSVSNVLRELIEASRADLEREARQR